jgi:hypothetical protein
MQDMTKSMGSETSYLANTKSHVGYSKFPMHNYTLFTKGLKIVSIMNGRLLLIYYYTFSAQKLLYKIG